MLPEAAGKRIGVLPGKTVFFKTLGWSPAGSQLTHHEAFDIVLLRDRDKLVYDAADQMPARFFRDRGVVAACDHHVV